MTAPDIDIVDRLLRDRVVELVEHFRGAPNKSLSNRQTVRFGRKGGLAVDIAGSKKGRITDFNDGRDKALSPLQFIRAEIGGTLAEAIQWTKGWLGIEGECPAPPVRREDPKPSSDEDKRREAKRRAAVRRIVAECRDPHGTPAESYLRNERGITAELPGAVRWRAKAWRHGGALVLLATDAAGAVQAVQEVYLTAEGTKAPVKVQKRTSGFLAGVAVRLPGTAPLTLIEGPEDALSTWQTTGYETWAALGGIGKLVEQVPTGSEVIVGRDADPEGSPADKGLRRAVEALVARGCRARVACPPRDPVWRKPGQKKIDFNDVLQNEGEEAIRAIIAAAEIFEPPAPHYPATPLPIGEAGALLTSTIEAWVAHAVAHVDGGGDARQVGAKAAAGTGKSRELIRALQAHPEANECHIDIMVPQHRLADELAWEAHGGRLQVRVIRGREYRQGGMTMCAKAKEARQVASAGFPVWDTMCRRLDPETGEYETCEFFGSCPYVAQFDDQEPAVRIMAHENLFLPRNHLMPAPHAVIIDESFYAKALRRTDFALDRLTAGLWRSSGREVSMDDQDRRDRIARTVRRALEAGEHPHDYDITAEDCRFVAGLEIGAIEGIGITPGMSHAAQRKRLEAYRRSEALKLYRFWKTLEAEIERPGPLCQIVLRRDVPGDDGELSDRLYLFWRRDLKIADVPVLLLDADLDPTIGTKLLPRLETVEVQVERHAEVIQVMDTPCSRQKVLAWDTAPEDEVKRAANRLADVQALLNIEAAKGVRVLLVTYKRAAERLKAPTGCAVEWFGNIRGIDRYKDFDTVIIAGREQPPVDAVEAQARALFADDPEPLSLTGELVEQKRGYRMRDGSLAEATVLVHPDPRVQALLEQVRERESGQAIDRLRLIWRDKPARVIVLSNVVLDLTVDRLTTWREIMPNALDRMIATGAVPLAPWADMAEAHSNLFPTAEAARKTVSRLTPDISHIEYFIGKCPELRTVTYRRLRSGKRAVTGQLAYDPRRVDPTAWLAEYLPGAELVTPAMAPVEVVDMPPVLAPTEPSRTAPPVTYLLPPLEDAAPRPPPAEPMLEDMDRLQRIVSSAGRLTSLSTRLEYARPPHRWGDFTDEFRWRARLTALRESSRFVGRVGAGQ